MSEELELKKLKRKHAKKRLQDFRKLGNALRGLDLTIVSYCQTIESYIEDLENELEELRK